MLQELPAADMMYVGRRYKSTIVTNEPITTNLPFHAMVAGHLYHNVEFTLPCA